VYVETRKQLRTQLEDFDEIENDNNEKKQSTIFIYKMFLAQEKALYKNLNMLKAQNQTFIGFFWAPVENEKAIIDKIGTDRGTRVVPYDDHTIAKPTFFKSTEFIEVFQEITDTYGIPSY